MKSFSLGLVFGTCPGLVFSLFKDQNGDRLGTNLKSNLIDTKNDATNLQQSLEKAKEAVKRFNIEDTENTEKVIDQTPARGMYVKRDGTVRVIVN